MNIKEIFLFSIFINISVVIFCVIFKSNLFLINTQISYFSAGFVIFITYITYKKSILKNAKIYAKTTQNKKDKEVSYKVISKIFRGQNLFSYLSIYRLVGYLILSFSIIFMIEHKIFNAVGYITGVSIIPISIVVLFGFRFMYPKKIS